MSMEHKIIYKNENEYCSFPLLEYKNDDIFIGFFKASKPDHAGLYDWVINHSDNFGEKWENNAKCVSSRFFKDGEIPRIVSDQYVSNDGKRFGATSWSIKNKREFKKYDKLGYVAYKRKKDVVVGSNIVYWTNKIYKYRQVIFGVNLFLLFPRHIEVNKQPFLSAYGYINKKYRPFIVKLNNEDYANYELIDMFNGNINANEYSIIEIDENVLYSVLRTPDSLMALESWSFDNGESWSYPKPLIKGHPPHLLKLNDGRILCTFGYRWDKMGIHAIISKEIKKGQIIWDKNIRILRDDAGYPSSLYPKKIRKKLDGWADVGYPVSIQLKDGSVLTVYYITTQDGITHIAQTKWEI